MNVPCAQDSDLNYMGDVRCYIGWSVYTMEGWDIAHKVKFLIVVNLVAARAILVPCVIQVDTLPLLHSSKATR